MTRAELVHVVSAFRIANRRMLTLYSTENPAYQVTMSHSIFVGNMETAEGAQTMSLKGTVCLDIIAGTGADDLELRVTVTSAGGKPDHVAIPVSENTRYA